MVFLSIMSLARDLGRVYAHARYEAMSDVLTQIPNRRYFFRILENLRDELYTILIIDLGNFKKIMTHGGMIRETELCDSLGYYFPGITVE